MASGEMAKAAAEYRTALANLKRVSRECANDEDQRPIVKAKTALGVAEETMVLRMVGELGTADPSKRDELYATFNRARTSAVYWPRIVASALKYAAADEAIRASL